MIFASHGKLLEKEYVKYCRNYGDAIVELARMDTLEIYSSFWEDCRKSRNLPLLKLADFLLQPVQRICKYPLHFTELLKVNPELLIICPNSELSTQKYTTVTTNPVNRQI